MFQCQKATLNLPRIYIYILDHLDSEKSHTTPPERSNALSSVLWLHQDTAIAAPGGIDFHDVHLGEG